MRLLLLNQFYPPDVAPTGRYLHDLARFLASRGCEVRVLCSRRSYDGAATFPRREIMSGVEVTRLRATGFGRRGVIGRLADYASFYLSLLWALMFQRKRPDLILSLTTPPYIGLLGKLAAWRYGCLHAHWIMDLYPDVMRAHGMTERGGLVFNTLQRLTRFQLRGAKAVLALGPVMAEKVSSYSRKGAPHTSVAAVVTGIPLWSAEEMSPWLDSEPNPLRRERGWDTGAVVFLYSGNMGLGHRFGEFLQAAKQLGPAGPRWAFCGGGTRRAEIEAFGRSNPSAPIEMLDYVPQSRLREHLGAADVHLASLDSAWQGLIVPSKIQGSFAAGRPVLFVGGADSETAAWIRESGGGWVVAENDLEGLLAAAAQAMDSRERKIRALAALKFARENFEMSAGCARIFERLQTARN